MVIPAHFQSAYLTLLGNSHCIWPGLKGMVGPKLDTGATTESWAWKRKHRCSQTKVPKGAKLTATIALEKSDRVQSLGLALEHCALAIIGSTISKNAQSVYNQ